MLALALVLLWQLGVGQARPGSSGSPAGEPGLCLALVAWWCGAGRGQALGLWTVALVGASAVTGIGPLWSFLLGCPAWLLVRALTRRRDLTGFLVLAAGLVSGIRYGAKLLFLSVPVPDFPLTLSGPTLPQSLWAELAPNVVFLVVFAALMGAAPGLARESLDGAIRNFEGG